MHKRAILLTVAVFAIAAIVVQLRHRNRLYFAELQQLQTERDAIDIEWGQLLLEQGAWAEQRRVEAIARTRLGMMLPSPDQIVIVYSHAQKSP